MNSRFPVDVDRLMASADIGMAGIRAGLGQLSIITTSSSR